MANPLTTKRNPYYENVKDSTVFTSSGVAKYIFDKAVEPLYLQTQKENEMFYVTDPAIGSGNLVKPLAQYHKEQKVFIFGYDIDDYEPKPCDVFYKENFMAIIKIDQPVNLFILNPPFNTDSRNRKWLKNNKMGKALLPEVFLDKIFELRPGTPVIMITPMGFLFNQRRKSTRWKKYSMDKVNRISSIMMLPLDAFPKVEFHCCIVCFNFPDRLLQPFYWFEHKYL